MDLSLSIRDKLGQSFELETVNEVKVFLEAEKQYWLEQKSNIGKNLTGHFANFPQQIDQYLSHVNDYENKLTIEPASTNIQQQQRNLETYKAQFIQWANQHWIYRGNPSVEALLEAYRYSSEAGNAFWLAITSKRAELSNWSFDAFLGNVMAYEFVLQDQSQMVKRRHAEKKAFSTLRNDLEEERNKQVSGFEAFRQDYLTWRADSQGEFNDWFADCKDRSDATITDHSTFFNQMTDHAIKRHQELEMLYVEKLRLEKPAKYWEDRAQKLRCQGIVWSIGLAVVLLSGIGYFTYLFTHWLNGQEMTISLHSLQGAVLLAVIISAFVFCVRVLSRLVFSAFHLQRDAEERQQLAYVYLALSNETHADEESRKIILQALFSRAETGLLASESGPTMPGVDGLAGLITKTAKN